MMFAAFLTQAAVGKQVEEVKIKSGEEKMRIVDWGNDVCPGEEALCTITMKGKIDLGPIEAEVSCTTSATTCEAATVKCHYLPFGSDEDRATGHLVKHAGGIASFFTLKNYHENLHIDMQRSDDGLCKCTNHNHVCL